MINVVRMKKKESIWRSESAIEETVLIGTQYVVIFRYAGESELDVENRLDRWRSGEEVRDVVAGPKGSTAKI